MTTFIRLTALLAASAALHAATLEPWRLSVSVDTNGVLTAPSTFWASNAAAISAASGRSTNVSDSSTGVVITNGAAGIGADLRVSGAAVFVGPVTSASINNSGALTNSGSFWLTDTAIWRSSPGVIEMGNSTAGYTNRYNGWRTDANNVTGLEVGHDGGTNAFIRLRTAGNAPDDQYLTITPAGVGWVNIAGTLKVGGVTVATIADLASRQTGSANLTNWSLISTTAVQPAAAALSNLVSNPNLYHASNANLTLWQSIVPNDKQPAAAALSNLISNPNLYHASNANLTLWQAITPNDKQPAAAALSNLVSNPNLYQASNANLTLWAAITPSGKQDVLVNSSGLRSALTDPTGTGGGVFSNAPNIFSPTISGYPTLATLSVTGNQTNTGSIWVGGGSGVPIFLITGGGGLSFGNGTSGLTNSFNGWRTDENNVAGAIIGHDGGSNVVLGARSKGNAIDPQNVIILPLSGGYVDALGELRQNGTAVALSTDLLPLQLGSATLTNVSTNTIVGTGRLIAESALNIGVTPGDKGEITVGPDGIWSIDSGAILSSEVTHNYTPQYYTPSGSPMSSLTSHLVGIDAALGASAGSLLTNGTRSMSGNLNMGGFAVYGISGITNTGAFTITVPLANSFAIRNTGSSVSLAQLYSTEETNGVLALSSVEKIHGTDNNSVGYLRMYPTGLVFTAKGGLHLGTNATVGTLNATTINGTTLNLASANITNFNTAWKTLSPSGTNVVVDLATGRFFEVWTGTNTFLIWSNLTANASGKVIIYGTNSVVKTNTCESDIRATSASTTFTNVLTVGYQVGSAAQKTNTIAGASLADY